MLLNQFIALQQRRYAHIIILFKFHYKKFNFDDLSDHHNFTHFLKKGFGIESSWCFVDFWNLQDSLCTSEIGSD